MSADNERQPTMRLRIVGLGHSIPLTVDRTSTVSDIKSQIESDTSIPAEEQRLLFKSKRMNDVTMAIGPTTRDGHGYIVSFGVGLVDGDEVQLEREEGDNSSSPVRQFVYCPNKMNETPGGSQKKRSAEEMTEEGTKHGADYKGEVAGSSSSPVKVPRRRSRWGSPINKGANESRDSDGGQHQATASSATASGMWTCEVCDVIMATEFKEAHLKSKGHVAQSEEVLRLYRDMQQMQAVAEVSAVEAESSDTKTAEEAARQSATGQPVPTGLDREEARVTTESLVEDKRNKDEGGSRKRPRWEPPPKAAVAKKSSPSKRNRQSDEKSAKFANVSRPSAAATRGQLGSKSSGAVSSLPMKRWEPPAAAALPGKRTSKFNAEDTTKPPKARSGQPGQSLSNIKTEETGELAEKKSQESGQSRSKIKTEETAESTKARSELLGQSALGIKTEETAELAEKKSQESGQSALGIKTEETAESTKGQSEKPGQSALGIKTEDEAAEPEGSTKATSYVPTNNPYPKEANAEFKYAASARKATARSCAAFASQCRTSAVSWKPESLPARSSGTARQKSKSESAGAAIARSATARSCAAFASQCRTSAVSWKPENLLANASFLRSSGAAEKGQSAEESAGVAISIQRTRKGRETPAAAAQPARGAVLKTEQTDEPMTARTDLAIAASSDRKSKKEKPVVGPSHRNGQGRGPSMVTAAATVCAPFASQSRSLTGSWKPDDLLANVLFSQPAGTTSRERQPTEKPAAAAESDPQPEKLFEPLATSGAVEPVKKRLAKNDDQDDDSEEEGDGGDNVEHWPSICLTLNQPYICLACNIDLKSKERYAAHVEGKRHKRKMEACFCAVCRVRCHSEHNYMQHLSGKKHRKKCKEMEEKLRNGGGAKEDVKKKVRDGDGKKVADLSACAKNLRKVQEAKVQEDLAGKEWRTKMEIATNESGAPLAVVKYMVARNAHTSQCKLAVCPDRLFRYRCVVTGCPKHIDVDTSAFEDHPRFYTEYLWARRRTKRGLGLLSVQVPLDYSSLNQVSRAAASAGMRSTGAQLTLVEGIRAESGQGWIDGLAAQLGAFKSALLSNPSVEIEALKAHPTTTGFGATGTAGAASATVTNATLAVFSISNGTTAGHIRAVFEPRCGGGKITRVELRSSRGFGFIDFDSENAVTRIMQQAAARPISLFGRPLRVQRGTSHAASPRADASAVIVAEISLSPGAGACRNGLIAGKDSGGLGLALPQRPLHVTLGVVLAEEAEAKIDRISAALVGTKVKVFARGLSVLAPSFEEKMIFERNIDRCAVTEFVRVGKEAAERLNNAMSADCGSSPVPPPPVSETTKKETKEDRSDARHNENDVNDDGGGGNSGQAKYECDLSALSALDDRAILAEARRYISKVATLCARVASVDEELSNFGF